MTAFDRQPPPLRPTSSELWRRVASLRPRLAPPARLHRQRTRGQTWHIVEDPLTHRFARLDEAAHAFVARLDGRRTAQQALDQATEHMGERAPTQGEAVQLLSQLHEQGLLPHDQHETREPVLRKRRERRRKEFRSSLGALLFIRVPRVNPDRFFEALAPFARPFVSRVGAILWCLLLAVGGWAVLTNADRLTAAGAGVLDTANLPILYLPIALIKLAHECGHALLLKCLARNLGGARVPRIGVLFLLFLPFPYVDASGAWTLRSKWSRALVGAGGMVVELAIGALAAIVWANAAEGSATSVITFNALLASTVSTLLFNANPLLRYDGYHILCDLLETPNLAPRATQHFRHLLKKHVCAVRHTHSPSAEPGERRLLLAYAIASGIYRLALYALIGRFVLNQQLLLGGLLLTVAAIELVALPSWRACAYVAFSDEAATRRPRAVLTSIALLAAITVPVTLVPLPRHAMLEGVVESASSEPVYAREAGVIIASVSRKTVVEPGQTLVELDCEDLARDARMLELERDRIETLRRVALRDSPADAPALASRLAVIEEQLAFVNERIETMRITAERGAVWRPAPGLQRDNIPVQRGGLLGTLVRDPALRVTVPVDQTRAGTIDDARSVTVRDRAAQPPMPAQLERIARHEGSEGNAGLIAEYTLPEGTPLREGQRVLVRVRTNDATLLERAKDAIRRVFDQRGEQ